MTRSTCNSGGAIGAVADAAATLCGCHLADGDGFALGGGRLTGGLTGPGGSIFPPSVSADVGATTTVAAPRRRRSHHEWLTIRAGFRKAGNAIGRQTLSRRPQLLPSTPTASTVQAALVLPRFSALLSRSSRRAGE